MMAFERVLLQLLVLMSVASCLRAAWYTNLGPLEGYDPLADSDFFSKYKRATEWISYHTGGIISFRTADFHRGKLCRRVLEFLAHEVLLHSGSVDCEDYTDDRMFGLTYVGSTIKYLDEYSVHRVPSGRFLVLQRYRYGACARRLFELDSTRSSLKSKNDLSDKSCREYTPMPPMLLLSISGETGKYEEATKEWTTFNPWEPLGFVTREYTYLWGDICFRLMVVTSYGRAVQTVKLSCGAVTDVTSTDHSLRLGNVMYVTIDSQDQFTVLINIQNGYCVKNTITVQMKEGSSESKIIDTDDNVKVDDENCRSLVQGEIKDATIAKHVVDRLRKKPMRHLYNQEILNPYQPKEELLHYNIARDMGILIRNYTSIEKNITIVTLVARGVSIVPVKMEPGTPIKLVIRNNVVYYGKDVAFIKLSAQNGYQKYQVLTRLDQSRCRCDQYDVAEDGSWKGGKYQEMETDAASTPVEGNCVDDTGCSDLIEGKNLKTAEALTFGDVTDEMGVPKSLLPPPPAQTPAKTYSDDDFY